MKSRPCPRLFEAEALRDGRLAGAERASFEKHVAGCPSCSREVAALDALGGALRAVPCAPADELRVRRERLRLLAKFDSELVAPDGSMFARSAFARRRWLSLAAPVVLAASALGVWRVRSGGRTARPVEASRGVIHADGATAWSERVEADRDVIALTSGALSIHVDHASRALRLVVELPDGELEDTGTTFTVGADGGRTTRVAVQEGSVVLRLRGQPSVAIGVGEVWTPPAPVAVASGCASAPLPSEATPGAPRRSSPPRAAAPRAPATTAEAADDASVAFRAAMNALDRGADADAAAAFARFVSTYPGDPRAEDAAYMRVLALERGGDATGVREAAGSYLHKYPNGFRRAEVEGMSR